MTRRGKGNGEFDWLDDPPEHSSKGSPDAFAQTKRIKPGHKLSSHRLTMTDAKWQKFLDLAANGLRRADILKAIRLTKETFDAYMITSVAAGKQLREADAIWTRRAWSLDDIEDMLTKISMGSTVKGAGVELGHNNKKIGQFLMLVRRDARVRDMYDLARELQSEAWMDDNIDIADNRGEDTFVDAKGMRKTDHGVIQRDRLRVDTRQWTMGAMNRKRFGEQKHIDHSGEIQVNHAVVLSHARRRLEKIKKSVTIDNSTQVVVNE